MEKVADKVSQLVKRNSKEKLTENIPDSPLPPFKPIPKIQLKRESSLPRIEVDRPATPVGPLASSSPSPLTLPSAKLPQNDYSLGQIIPPNAKKLRVRSFLWVKPTASSYLDTSIYYQVNIYQALSNCRWPQTKGGGWGRCTGKVSIHPFEKRFCSLAINL